MTRTIAPVNIHRGQGDARSTPSGAGDRTSGCWREHHHGATGRLAALEGLKPGGNVGELDLLADPDEPRDLFGMLLRAGAMRPAA